MLDTDCPLAILAKPDSYTELSEFLLDLLQPQPMQFELQPSKKDTVQVLVRLPIPELHNLPRSSISPLSGPAFTGRPPTNTGRRKEKAGRRKGSEAAGKSTAASSESGGGPRRAKQRDRGGDSPLLKVPGGSPLKPGSAGERTAECVALWERTLANLSTRLNASSLPRIGGGGRGGAGPTVRAWYRTVAVTLSGTLDQYRALEAAARAGDLGPGVAAVRRAPPPPGLHPHKPGTLMPEGGEQLSANLTRLYAERRAAVLAERFVAPPPPRRPAGPDPRPPPRQVQAGTSTLAKAVAGLEPFEVLELPEGRYVANLVVTAPDVVIRGVGPGPVVLQGDPATATVDLQAPHCRIEGLTILNAGTAHPAVLVQSGTPEIVDCTLTGAGGGMLVQSGPSGGLPEPRLLRTVVTACAHRGGIEFRSPGRSVMEDCEIRANHLMGLLIAGFRCNVVVNRCRFIRGGGAGAVVEEEAAPLFTNCVFDRNMCPALLVESRGVPSVCYALLPPAASCPRKWVMLGISNSTGHHRKRTQMPVSDRVDWGTGGGSDQPEGPTLRRPFFCSIFRRVRTVDFSCLTVGSMRGWSAVAGDRACRQNQTKHRPFCQWVASCPLTHPLRPCLHEPHRWQRAPSKAPPDEADMAWQGVERYGPCGRRLQHSCARTDARPHARAHAHTPWSTQNIRFELQWGAGSICRPPS